MQNTNTLIKYIKYQLLGLMLLGQYTYAQNVKTLSDSTEAMDFRSLCFLKEDIQYSMQSSYDRSGGNDDGFSGKYSVLRKENNKAVISEIAGAGTITRIWFPSNGDYPEGPMGLRNKRIYIYLDGDSKPVIDMPIVDMFNNSSKQFPYPLCGMGLGGCWSYVPIPFNNGAKIMVEGDSARFFHVQYNTYNKSKSKTFSTGSKPLIKGYNQLNDAVWHMGDIKKLVNADAIINTRSYALQPGENSLPFQQGQTISRGIIVKASSADMDVFLKGSLSITWDNADSSAVNVPLSMFFIREKDGLEGRSLFAGTIPGGGGVYNFYPMPYQNRANVKLVMHGKCNVEITTVFEKPLSTLGMAYLHMHHQKDYPTTPGKKHVFVDVNGEGQYAGTYLRATGKSLSDTSNGIIYWTGCLEGDEVFEVDGKIVERGTGTEDYFNAGWNGLPLRLDRPGIYPLHGFTLFDAGKDSSSVATYRWRMSNEVVPFKKHFRADIEVGPDDKNLGNYESISYYYLKSPGLALSRNK